MFSLREPLWGENLVHSLNGCMNGSDFLSILIPITADIFVFLFPVLLVVIYFAGVIQKRKSIKESALWVFWAAILTSVVNILIQMFFEKSRPSVELFGYEETETILHRFLPNSSFPSDHAAMSMGFAMGLLIRGIKIKKKSFVWMGIVFLVFSLIMGFSRIMVGVHWPTDILGGFAVGILVPLILSQKGVYKRIQKILINPIINLEQRIMKKLFHYDQPEV